MPSSAVRANISPSRAAPSSMEYSVCTWRCTKESFARDPADMWGDRPFPDVGYCSACMLGSTGETRGRASWGRPSAYVTSASTCRRPAGALTGQASHRAPTVPPHALTPGHGWSGLSGGKAREGSGAGGGAPPVPGRDLDPGADPAALAVAVGAPPVVPGEPVDVGEVRVVLDPHHPALEADVGVPALLVERGEGDPRV